MTRAGVAGRLLRAGTGLVTMTAPAGYGKTTATALWDDADERPFAWVRVDHLDDDPVHLLLHIATAVAHVHRVDPAAMSYLHGPGRCAQTHFVPVVAELLETVGPIVVVLDDAHRLATPATIEVLRSLLDAAPASTAFAVLARHGLPLNIARRRLLGGLVEIGPDVLRLTDDEARRLLRAVGGPVDDTTAAVVVDRCEGWAAGVVLAAAALGQGATVESLGGRWHVVADYVLEEFLARLDGDSARFLMESSACDGFTAEHLDEVLERNDSAVRLGMLIAAGDLLLIPPEEGGDTFRYHRLFGDVLRRRLRACAPQRYREIAARRADVLAREGDVDGALVQALDAGDRARAAALVNSEAVRLAFDGRAGVLARRLAMLDSRTFTDCPDAAVARAWYGVTVADAATIQRSLLLAQRADRGDALSDGTPSVAVSAALIGSLVGRGGVADVLRQSEIVRNSCDSLANPWWGAATVMQGAAEAMLGHPLRARMLLESALPVVEDLPGFGAAALAHLALLDLAAGDDQLAMERCDAARMLADKYDLCDLVPMVVVYGASAVMSARLRDGSGAREAVGITESLLGRLGQLAARTALLGHGLLAWSAAALGDPELLHRHLDAADRARAREPDAVALTQRVERIRAMVAANADPLTAAELRLLPYLATHLSLQKIAEELVIGRETAKSHAAAIYRKLAVSSRADAVAEARRVGLLATAGR